MVRFALTPPFQMEPKTASANLLRFGTFEVDNGSGTLTRSGARVKIQEQPFRLLLILLERPEKLSAATNCGDACGRKGPT